MDESVFEATAAPVEVGRDPEAAVAVGGLERSFEGAPALGPLSLRAEAGEVLGLVGRSGCGKSTLLRIVCGLDAPSAGSAAVAGHADANARLARCAYMPQRDLLLPWLSALDNAALAPRNRGASRAEARRRAAPLFDRFGLGGYERARPTQLSGGMRQRVAFLRTLLAGKPVLCLDEPFAALDAITRSEMQEWLAGAVAAEARTVLLVSHDVEEALYLSDRVMVLSSRPGRPVAQVRSPKPRSRPRLEAIASGPFVAARERALAALAGGSR